MAGGREHHHHRGRAAPARARGPRRADRCARGQASADQGRRQGIRNMTLQVAQVLYFVPDDRRWSDPFHVQVTKVGRVWAQTNKQLRIKIETGRTDCYPYGRAWRSEQEWRDHERRACAWSLIKDYAYRCYQMPEHLSQDDLDQIVKLLRISHE